MSTTTQVRAALPAGLTHPYDPPPANRQHTMPRAIAYHHGHTFTWVRGDAYVSVQNGRCANVDQVVLVVRDPHPGVPVLLGYQPLVSWAPAPSDALWANTNIMIDVAESWVASARAGMRMPTQRRAS